MTLIGGLSIVTRQYAGDRRATRICPGFVAVFTFAMGSSFVADFVAELAVVMIPPYIDAHAPHRSM
jgi:hypothetical protein